jgi:hypothetical protein
MHQNVSVVLFWVDAKRVVLFDDKTLGEFIDGVDDIGGFETARFPLVDVEDLKGVLNDAL